MNNIGVIGYGNIGDKARQLVEKTPKLREIGFYTPRITVLAEDRFSGNSRCKTYRRPCCSFARTIKFNRKIIWGFRL